MGEVWRATDETLGSGPRSGSPGFVPPARSRARSTGVPLGITVHSLVWYPPAYFLDEVPETWEQMITLSDAIAAGGDKPW